MSAPKEHIHITEREGDGTWEDCTWCSGLEWYRLTYDKSKPATHAEAEALRAAAGKPPTGGSNTEDLRRGIKARYGVSVVPEISGFSNLWNALLPGMAAMVQGSMKAFPPTHRLSKWDPSFDGGHAVCVMRISATELLWCDPEAPTGAAVPVTITKAELQSFVTAFGGTHLVAPILSMQEAQVDLKTYTPGYTADVKPQSNVRAEPRIASTKLHATTANLPVAVIGTVVGDVDPGNGSNVWYALWHENRVEYTAKDNIINLKPPAPADSTLQSQLDAANAANKSLQATVDTIPAQTAAANKAGWNEALGATAVAIEKLLPAKKT